jgi:hypothetical protein
MFVIIRFFSFNKSVCVCVRAHTHAHTFVCLHEIRKQMIADQSMPLARPTVRHLRVCAGRRVELFTQSPARAHSQMQYSFPPRSTGN